MPPNYGAARANAKKRKAKQISNAEENTSTTETIVEIEKETNSTIEDKNNSKSSNKKLKPSTVKAVVEVPRITRKIGGLPWKNIVLPSELGFDEDGGLLELDEVEGVQVLYGSGLVTFTVKDQPEALPPVLTKKQKKALLLNPALLEEDEIIEEGDVMNDTDSRFPGIDFSTFKTEEQLMEEEGEEGMQDGGDDNGQEDGSFDDEDGENDEVSEDDELLDDGEEFIGIDDGEFEGIEEIEVEEEVVLPEVAALPFEVVPVKEPKAKKVKSKKEKVIIEPQEASATASTSTLPALPEFTSVEVDLPAWAHLPLPEPLYRALHELKFDVPTAIQERALSVEIGATPWVEPTPVVPEPTEPVEEEWGGIIDESDEPVEEVPIEPYQSMFEEEAPIIISTAPNTLDRDLVGVAQTGSGKTLAYGLPILSFILSQPPPPLPTSNQNQSTPSRLAALILAPTRELALQVRSAIAEVAMRVNKLLPNELQDPNKDAPRKRERGRHIVVVALTGGMSVEKQKRQLMRGGGADILVATPGRLWDLIGEDDALARAIKGIKFLVIDEADRMIENGHFAELDSIVRLTRRKTEALEDTYTDDFASATVKSSSVDVLPPREDMRTFVFSATMSKDLQRNLKKRHRKFKPGQPEDGLSSLDDLLLKLDFRDPDPELIDLSPEGGLVAGLKECKVECLMPDKDVHLYHFLMRYPGRTIVFLSSIDGIRRLHPLLVLLGLDVMALHSGMQQRARLKYLDRFKTSETAILLATDVAARGLDIPAVSHVVHYQLPRSADVYVHRSGRTARAGKEGLALQLVSPEEKQMQRLLMASLGKDTDFPELPSDFSILDSLKARIELAKKIESAMHKATKEAHEDNWLKQAADALDIEIDSDMDFSDGNEDSTKKSRKAMKSKAFKVKTLKAELQKLLDKPLMMRGISTKYITTRGRVGFVDQLVGGTNHSSMMGIETASALEDLPLPKKKRPRARKD